MEKKVPLNHIIASNAFYHHDGPFIGAELDAELRRRKQHPPVSLNDPSCRAEYTTVDKLRVELDGFPVDGDQKKREWMEWELALAERQAVTEPGMKFFRVVSVKPVHWRTTSMTTPQDDKAEDKRSMSLKAVRERAAVKGYVLEKSRIKIPMLNNHGGYRLVVPARDGNGSRWSGVAIGHNYELTLADVQTFLDIHGWAGDYRLKEMQRITAEWAARQS